jgi:alcohol dehydrogenase class IV
MARETRADLSVTIGGGSATDAAKGVRRCLRAGNAACRT